MNCFRTIDFTTWKRKPMYDFFSRSSSPNYCISTKFEAGEFFPFFRKRGDSVFIATLYAFLKAANDIPEMRQRQMGDKVVEYASVAAMTPVSCAEPDLFRQIWCEFYPDFDEFRKHAVEKINEAKMLPPKPVAEEAYTNFGYICVNCAPWYHFDGAEIPDYTLSKDIPIAGWGKLKNNLLPTSTRFNHCFMDGVHVGRFFKSLQKYLSHPESLL